MNLPAKIAASITRRFYPRGTQRMLRLFFNPQKLKIKTVMGYDGDLKINVDTSSYVEWELFFQGYYEKWVIRVMKKIIREGDVVMDIGANIGTHTLVMAKLVGAEGKVFAFDPDPQSAKRLKDNVDINHFTNTKILELGLSDKKGSMTLYVYGKEILDQGTASLYDLPKLEKTKLSVPVLTLDEVFNNENINRLNFLKIDTRGSDLPIIRGAAESIKKCRPFVVFEYNHDNWSHSGSRWEEARDFFQKNQYLLSLIGTDGNVRLIQDIDAKTSYNILAIPKEKESRIKHT